MKLLNRVNSIRFLQVQYILYAITEKGSEMNIGEYKHVCNLEKNVLEKINRGGLFDSEGEYMLDVVEIYMKAKDRRREYIAILKKNYALQQKIAIIDDNAIAKALYILS